jgi:hypothetical protein
MSCGLEGALCRVCREWAVDGLELTSCGRGGSGGGVPSLDGCVTLLEDAVREALFMMFSVGFAKSRDSTLLVVFDDALLLVRTGVEEALFAGSGAPTASGLPVSGI